MDNERYGIVANKGLALVFDTKESEHFKVNFKKDSVVTCFSKVILNHKSPAIWLEFKNSKEKNIFLTVLDHVINNEIVYFEYKMILDKLGIKDVVYRFKGHNIVVEQILDKD